MIKSTDIVQRAALSGLVLNYALVKQAHQSVDLEAIETTEKARYSAKVWDGNPATCPLDTPDRWLHGKDRNSEKAVENLAAGGCVYFLFRDDKLVAWQPYAGVGGHKMVNDPQHPQHWEKDVAAHIDLQAEAAIDDAHYNATLDKALELHDASNTPYAVTTAIPRSA